MSRGHNQLIDMPRVLIVGPARPSTAGIASYIDDLLSPRMRERFELRLLDPLVVKRRSKVSS